MGDDVWFLHHAGAQLGPMSRSELQELAARGEVDPKDLVWQPSLSNWEPARTVPGLFSATAPVVESAGETPVVLGSRTWEAKAVAVPVYLRPIEALLGFVGGVLPVTTLDRIDRVATVTGHIAYPCAAVPVTALLLVLGVRNRSAVLIVIAVAVLPIALFLSYTAVRFLAVLRHHLEVSSTALGARDFLDGVAALAVGTGVLTCAVGLALTMLGAGAVPLLVGMSTSLVLLYAAGTVLNPRALNVTLRDEAATDQEALAALAVLAKLLFLRVLPMAFAVAATAGALTVLWLLVMAFGQGPLPEWAAVRVCGRVLAVALLPVAAWLGFLLVWLALEVVSSLIGTRAGSSTTASPE